MSSFTKKRLRVTITLANGNFASANGNNSLTLEGYRIIASIQHAGGMAATQASVAIYGMLQADMNQLSVLAWQILSVQQRNMLTIEAGDDETGLSQVFSGSINTAFGDYTTTPEVFLSVQAMAGYFSQISPVAPASYKGSVDVATVMSRLATGMGVEFENNGVSVQLVNPYFSGTAITQARSAATAANINMSLDNGVLSIWPMVGARAGEVPVLNKDTGLIGYPTFDIKGIALRCLFNPSIRFGALVKVESPVTRANGVWKVYSISHDLSSETLGGPWFSTVYLTEQGNVVVRQ